MRTLTNAEILEVWERGCQALPAQRAVLLLAACAGVAPDEIASYSIGRRDAQLLELRGLLFGRHVVSLTPCPHCGESVELEFNVDEIATPAIAAESVSQATVTVDGYAVRFRLPNSLDQLALAKAPDMAAARHTLLSRCVLAAQREGDEVAREQLPATVLTALTERMAELDPLANIFLAVACPACGRSWQALFDICDFFWRELQVHAQRLVQEVHRLASAYGWSEAAILALSAGRRRAYLELVNQ